MSLHEAGIADPASEHPDGRGRPYGLTGLVVSTVLILAASLLVCVLVAGAAFLVAMAIFGWEQLLDHFGPMGATGTDAMVREKLGIAGSLIAYAALSAAVFAAARLRGKAHWRDLIAWRAWSPGRNAAWIWAFAIVLIVYSLGADAAISHFVPRFNSIVHIPSGVRWGILFVLLAAVFAPVAEELLFRGWLYTSLRSSFGVAAATIVVSVLFAAAHWESTHLYALAVFPVGLGLAWIRERTGSLKASIFVHGFYNGVASLLLFLAK